MKNFNKFSYVYFLIIIAVLFQYSNNANAGDRKQIYDKTQKLYKFLGTWEGSGKLGIGNKTVPVEVKFEVAKTVDGWGLMINQTISAEGMDPYKATSMVGFQPGHEHLHLFKISNYGETFDFYGYWIDESNYELKYEGMDDGKPFVELMNMEFKDSNNLEYSTISHRARRQVSSFSVSLKKTS